MIPIHVIKLVLEHKQHILCIRFLVGNIPNLEIFDVIKDVTSYVIEGPTTH